MLSLVIDGLYGSMFRILRLKSSKCPECCCQSVSSWGQ